MIGRKKKVELHAGGIVFRIQRGEPRVLIVTARGSRRRWVLPKGRVKRGEPTKDAAVREVEEEAGVTGRVIAAADACEYSVRGGRVRIEYFLIEYRRTVGEPQKKRQIEWCAVEDAIAQLTFASARRTLLNSHDKLTRLAKQAQPA
jgi:8-oxo-dGTP pyrophosphatase MutT (NUDIX family)